MSDVVPCEYGWSISVSLGWKMRLPLFLSLLPSSITSIYEDVSSEFGGFDILVLSSRIETFGSSHVATLRYLSGLLLTSSILLNLPSPSQYWPVGSSPAMLHNFNWKSIESLQIWIYERSRETQLLDGTLV